MNSVKYILVWAIAVMHTNSVKAQLTRNKNIKYTYVNGCDRKMYMRHYLSDSVFVEKYFYSHTEANPADSQYQSTSDTFKVVKGCWWYSLKGVFYPFFSPAMFKEGKMTERHYNYIPKEGEIRPLAQCIGYLPLRMEYENGKPIYLFKVNYNGCGEKHFTQIDNALFYFDADIGFIRRKFWTCNMDEMKISSKIQP